MSDFPAMTYDPDGEYTETPVEDPTKRSAFEAGYVQTSVAFTRTPKKFKFQYSYVINRDKNKLAYFEAVTCRYGALFFDWKNFYEAYGQDNFWIKKTAYTLGEIVRPVAASGRSYRCTTAGTTHATDEPTWPTTKNATITDGSVVWTENTRTVRFASPIQFKMVKVPGIWAVDVEVAEV